MSTSCSCIECIYNPQSNDHKTKIDKLYRSKYLPRRKRALLEKLVKTRAAYDELRDQILFGRIDDTDSEFGSYGSDDFDRPDKVVVKIVDLVDKGQFPLLQSSVNLHNECCECCYCTSKNKIKRHSRANRPLPTDAQLRKNLEFRKHKTRGERNAVRFSSVRSEPCICTLKFSDLKNISRKIRHISSKQIFKRQSKKSVDNELGFTIESPSKFNKARNRIRKSLRSFQTNITSKELFKGKPKEYKEPVDCECKLDDDEISFTIESPSKFKKTQNKIKEGLRSIETSSKEFYRKLSLKRRKNEVEDFESFEEYYEKPSLTERSKRKIKQTGDKLRDGIRSSVSKFENAFRIKKDSIMLFKEKLQKEKALKAWTCDPDFCVPNMDECIPEECYEKIKVRESKRAKKQQVDSYKPEVESYQSQVSVVNFRIDPKPPQKLQSETKRKSRKDNVICECRTKTRSTSSMTRRRRTQKSMSDSIIVSSDKKTDTSSERVNKNKKDVSQNSMTESDEMMDLHDTPSKRAVKISSSFNFEIEFYKDKGPSLENESNSIKSEYDSENDKVFKYKNANSQHTIREKKKSTQTFHISSAEKLPFPRECDPFMCVPGKCNPKKCAAILLKQSQANHELQRCLCTLQLQKAPKKQDEKYSMTRPIKLEQVSNSISTQTTNNSIRNTGNTQNLLPYECEPHLCTPGECSPMICFEAIKKRNAIKNKSINTLAQRSKGRDVKSSSAMRSRPVGTKVRSPMQRKRFSREKSGLSSSPIEKSLSSSTTLNRQVVRIGSCFKFDIEFYKNTNNPDGNISVPKDRETYENREEIRNSSSLHTKDSGSTKSKQTASIVVVKSFIKRCFCTKLYRDKSKDKKKHIKRRSTIIMTDIKKKKSRQHQTKIVKCECDNESEKPLVKTKASMTSTVINYVKHPAYQLNRNLLPYECEPFFCTPGKCEPYVCLERIKSRNNKGIKTHSKHIGSLSKKTTSTVTTTGNIYPSRKVQAGYATRRKKIGYDREAHGSNFDNKKAFISKSSPSPPKQGFRIGSSIRFDIEIYKTNKFPESTILEKKEENKIERNVEVTSVKKKKLKTRGMGDYAEVRSRTSGTKDSVKSKMSLTKPLKRCFCTLKLSKKPKQTVKKLISKTTTASSRIRMVKCECKVASTQTPKQTGKSKLLEDINYNVTARSNLLPYECEPHFCVPGKCDPYTCYERIKSRNLLKRCFCTLKLNKSSKNRDSATSLKKDKRTTGTETVQEKHRRHDFLPYECSPGVCDPGNCNPYKCLELIKKRNAINISHRDQFASTFRPARKSTLSETSRTGKRSQSTLNTPEQIERKDKHSKSIRNNNHGRQKNAKRNKKNNSSPSFSPHSKPRHAVRISSNCTFNIQFSKDKTGNIKNDRYRTSSDNFVSASGEKMSNFSKSHIDKSLNKESKQGKCFCTLKFHKKGRSNRAYRFNNDLEISRKMNDGKPGKRGAMEATREMRYKRHGEQRAQGRNMINITREERYRKQKENQKPPVEKPTETAEETKTVKQSKKSVKKSKETVQQAQEPAQHAEETVLITRERKEIKPEPPPVQYEYVYRTVKYTGDGNAPIVTEVNASQVDVNKLVATDQVPAQ